MGNNDICVAIQLDILLKTAFKQRIYTKAPAARCHTTDYLFGNQPSSERWL